MFLLGVGKNLHTFGDQVRSEVFCVSSQERTVGKHWGFPGSGGKLSFSFIINIYFDLALTAEKASICIGLKKNHFSFSVKFTFYSSLLKI